MTSAYLTGNTGQGMSDLTLIGIIDAANFRNMVLDQRDNVTENRASGKSDASDNTLINISLSAPG